MNDPNSQTLTARCAEHARQRPDQLAIICEGRRVTYATLHEESNQTAHALRAAGLRRASGSPTSASESEHYYEIVLACAKSGTVLVPVNWRLTQGEVDHILRDSDAELLFVEREFTDLAEQVARSLARAANRGRAGLRNGARRGLTHVEGRAPRHRPGAGDRAGRPGRADLHQRHDRPAQGRRVAHRSFFTFPAAMAESGLNWMDWRADDVSLIALPGFQIAGHVLVHARVQQGRHQRGDADVRRRASAVPDRAGRASRSFSWHRRCCR